VYDPSFFQDTVYQCNAASRGTDEMINSGSQHSNAKVVWVDLNFVGQEFKFCEIVI